MGKDENIKKAIEKIKQGMKEWEASRRKRGLPVSNEGTKTWRNAHKRYDDIWVKKDIAQNADE